MQSNIILEAFGNAKTVRNDNSSRFGKYIKLQYSGTGRMMQAQTTHFLLEKSRLVSVAHGERNYHVFYQTCCGLQGFEKQYYGLGEGHGAAQDFGLCNMGNTIVVSEEVDDSRDHLEVYESLQKCGVTEDECEEINRVIACCLHLGEVRFEGPSKL